VSVYERRLFWHGDYAVAEETVADGFIGHRPPDREVQGRETRARFGSLTFTLQLGQSATT
jgi:hypothetical protein